MTKLLDYFHEAVTTIEDVEKLKKLILQLAVHGKIVEQDVSDEPASELLKKIEKEKELLIQEKKIKRLKPLSSVSLKEISCEIPNNWEWVRLGNCIMTVIGGGTPSKNNSEYWNGEIPWASVKDLKDEMYLNKTIDRITRKGLDNSSSNVVPKNNIIISTRMGLGKIQINVIDVAINQDLKAIFLPKGMSMKYFYYFYKSLSIMGSGMTVKGIRQEELLNIPFPLPPLNEQYKIVEKIEELFKQCDQLSMQIAKKQVKSESLNKSIFMRVQDHTNPLQLRDLRFAISNIDYLCNNKASIGQLRDSLLCLAIQGKLVEQDPTDEPASVLLEKIKEEKDKLVKEKKIKKEKPFPQITDEEKPLELPNQWEWIRLGNIAFVTKLAGFEYTKYINLSETGEVPVIRAQNVRKGYLDLTNLMYINKDTSLQLERSALTKKALLMTFIGAGIGDVSLFEGETRFHLAPNVAKIELYNNLDVKILEEFLLYFLLSPTGRQEIFKHLKATAQPSLSMTTIRDAFIPVPPLNEQKRIVEKVNQLLALCDELEQVVERSKQESEKLIKVVLKEAFTVKEEVLS